LQAPEGVLKGDGNDSLPANSEGGLEVPATAPTVLARLTTGDPLLLESRCGKGTVITMTTGLDRTWNDLPTRSDYVPFLHEAIFATVSGRNQRNVDAGQPLVAQIVVDAVIPPSAEDYQFVSPAKDELMPTGTALDATLQLTTQETLIPGPYQLTPVDEAKPIDRFVVNYDIRENDADELTADDRAKLITNERLQFADSLDDLAQRMYGDESRAELWALLMFAFMAMLLVEFWMTRRIVERGYGE